MGTRGFRVEVPKIEPRVGGRLDYDMIAARADAAGRGKLPGAMVHTIRIFLSSPGDVAAERAQVRDLVLGLERGPFVRGRVHIDVVSWDDPHGGATMDARLTPQEAVDRGLPTPADCDLTLVLLWGRMGTPLLETRADGTPYLSGTDWEFDQALEASKPVLVYRRTKRVLLDTDDPAFDEKVAQKRRVDDFFRRFSGEGGTILRGHATYDSPDDLLGRVRHDVEHYLSERLSHLDIDTAPQAGQDAPMTASQRGDVAAGGNDYESPTAVAIRPTMMIVYRRDGWYVENKGRGSALNIIVAQKHVKGASRGVWFNPVRIPTLGPGEEMHLLWLGQVNDTGLGASYQDEDGRLFNSLTGNDLTRVVRERVIPEFPEERIRRHWEFLRT